MNEKYGMIVENSEEGLYHALLAIIENRKLLKKYKENLKEFKYDIRKIVKQIEDLLDGVTTC